jgi:hypothetical protein
MDLQDDANMPTCNLEKIVIMHGQCNLTKHLLIFMQQLMTSLEHLSNNQGIRIISWEEIHGPNNDEFYFCKQ